MTRHSGWRLAVLLVALVATHLLSACGDGGEEINVDERGLARARGGIEAMVILSEKGVVLDAKTAFDRIEGFFPRLVERLRAHDEPLATEMADAIARLRDAAERLNLEEMAKNGRQVDELLERSAAALGFSLPASMLPPPTATPSATPASTATAEP